MNRSETIGELAKALAKAQGEIKNAIKDSENPHFRSRYADLASVVDAIKGPLSSNGIAYVQTTQEPPEGYQGVCVETTLLHVSGEWLSGILLLPVSKVDAHGVGSALTYCRRYALAAITGVAPEDDDGNAAAKAAPPSERANEFMPRRVASSPDAGRRPADEQMEAALTAAAQPAPQRNKPFLEMLDLCTKVDAVHGAGKAKAVRLGIFPDSKGVKDLNEARIKELSEALTALLAEG